MGAKRVTKVANQAKPIVAVPNETELELAESRTCTRAIVSVFECLADPTTAEIAGKAALEATRSEFRWEYGTLWMVDRKAGMIRAVLDSGVVHEAFKRATFQCSFPEGQGMAGRAWKERALIFEHDVTQLASFTRRQEAGQSNLRSAVALPIIVGGEVVAVMDFFTTQALLLSRDRRHALGTIAKLVSVAIERLRTNDLRKAESEDARTCIAVAEKVAQTNSVENALRTAIDAVRTSFGWAYSAFWELDKTQNVLRPKYDGGTVGEAFRRVTHESTFGIGKGLPGRAWQEDRLVFVEDVTVMPGFVRAPYAKESNLKSAICFPVHVMGTFFGVMDFYTTDSVTLSQNRHETLAVVARLVSRSIEKIVNMEREVQLKLEIDGSTTILLSESSSLSSVATRLLENSARTSAEANQVASAGERIQSSTSSVASSAEELAASVKEISRDTIESARMARATKDAVTKADTQIQALLKSSESIGNVTKLIATIARQTNLLALNATIEAARAGDAGRGFAVVANEVKELAKQTASATEQINNQIETTQAETQSTVQSIQEAVKIIGRLDVLSLSVSAAIEEQTAAVADIARHAREVSSGVGVVAKNITSVAQSAKASELSAEQTSKSAISIQESAKALTRLTQK